MDPIDFILRQKLSVKIMVAVLVMGIAIGFYWPFLYRPLESEVSILEPELAKLEAGLATSRQVINEMPRYKAEFERIKGELDLAIRQLPEKSEIPSLLESISDIGRASGLEFVLFRPQKEVPKEFYAEIPVDMVVQGKYRDVLTFFDQISRMPRIVNISNVVIGSPKDQGSGRVITTSCNATTYKFIEKEEAK